MALSQAFPHLKIPDPRQSKSIITNQKTKTKIHVPRASAKTSESSVHEDYIYDCSMHACMQDFYSVKEVKRTLKVPLLASQASPDMT